MYQYKAKITRIIDGDTVDCDIEDYQITLETAKGSGRGKFGRILGKIINKDGHCANDLMCQEGHAVPYHGQSKEDIAAEHIKNRQIVNSK